MHLNKLNNIHLKTMIEQSSQNLIHNIQSSLTTKNSNTLAATLELSSEGIASSKNINLNSEVITNNELSEKQKKEELQNTLDQIKESDNENNQYTDLGKILEIAHRISNGDKVPADDEKKLLEYSPKLYQTAKAAAMANTNHKHKKYKSLLEDDNDLSKKMKDLLKQLKNDSSNDNTTNFNFQISNDINVINNNENVHS